MIAMVMATSCSRDNGKCDGQIKHCFYSKVIYGKKKARELDLPTANIMVKPDVIKEGVYCCSIFFEEASHQGLCYYDNKRPNVLEAHIYNYKGDLYGRDIQVILREFTREPVRNISIIELQKLIKKDAVFCQQ